MKPTHPILELPDEFYNLATTLLNPPRLQIVIDDLTIYWQSEKLTFYSDDAMQAVFDNGRNRIDVMKRKGGRK